MTSATNPKEPLAWKVSGEKPNPKTVHGYRKSSLPAMGLAALGIVFGDIGTSPLYTLKTVLALSSGKPDPAMVLGVLSLVIWTLIIITTVKYVAVAMSISNDGEGGILALMSLIGIKKKNRPAIVAAGLFGAALIYGDGAITPAISVLSALEGLNMATPSVQPYVLPGAVAILVLLFAAQPLGTQRIGKAFGPIMAFWFLALAATGISGVLHHPAVFAALNPLYGLHYLAAGGLKGFLVLGAVFLCVTGAEALYADMGHFGPKPIRIAWMGIVFPSLILNYAGQAAVVLAGAPTDGNIFFQLCPAPLLIPMVVLATLATVIASQAVITGAFSMTRQAIQLGWLPRVAVKQTSDEGYGQIYVGSINWLLMIVTLALTLGFKKSDNLASAYGIAVSLTMLMTTVLLFIAMREIWKWSVLAAGAAATFLFVVDAAFFSANLVKIADGGYIPLLLAAAVYALMWIWHHGSEEVALRLEQGLMPVADFTAKAAARETPRVPGTAIFLTRANRDVPPVLLWHLQHNRALHKQLMVLTVNTASVPWINASKHLTVQELAPNFWRAEAIFGFMERPDIPALLATAPQHDCAIDLSDVTYYVGHASIRHREDGQGLPRWQEALYAAMERNSSHVGDVLRLPPDNTVEIGRQVAI
ncbi:MAG: trkD [Rhodospirillales bacterium]|nr:trkD [Rhodospirillales bacterium]